ncbi:MAG: hypothetical protein RLP14_01010 [Owenweeksia sp.]
MWWLIIGLCTGGLLFTGDSFQNEAQYVKNRTTGGQIVSEGWLQKGKKERYWKFYTSSGVVEREGHYRKDKREDYWFFYYPDGQKKMEGRFVNNRMNGLWMYYNAKGKLIKQCDYHKSRADGYCVLYEEGEMVKAERFEKGEKTGEWTSYLKFMADNPQWLRKKG